MNMTGPRIKTPGISGVATVIEDCNLKIGCSSPAVNGKHQLFVTPGVLQECIYDFRTH